MGRKGAYSRLVKLPDQPRQAAREASSVAEAPRSRPSFVPLAEAARRLGHDGSDWRAAARAFPVRWPAGYLELAEGPGGDPVRRMGAPDPAELDRDPGDLPDPVGEAGRQPHPFVVQKHADRAILIVTARCHFYCRFCFRRAFPGGEHEDPAPAEVRDAIRFLGAQAGLREIILSGGDPLVLSDRRLAEILEWIAEQPGVERVRVHTRAPVHFPERVTPELARLLAAAGRPARVVTHFNHAVELREESLAAVALLQGAGLPVLNQSVLLRGVNDTARALVALLRGLARAGIEPYYLHHPDRVPGNASFRLSLDRGLEVWDELRLEAAGLPLPAYVIDLPDGSGKVPVTSLVRLGAGRWRAPGGLELEDIPASE